YIPNTEVKHSRGEDSWACPCEHSTLPGPFFICGGFMSILRLFITTNPIRKFFSLTYFVQPSLVLLI
ncbi:hypothetical protein ACTNED_10675, partial [Absicoccus porci]|uniref:hypothetical protein n=1 Tax=Absicoccus porci TaxID=2486576 RepID=UPI003F8A23E2